MKEGGGLERGRVREREIKRVRERGRGEERKEYIKRKREKGRVRGVVVEGIKNKR